MWIFDRHTLWTSNMSYKKGINSAIRTFFCALLASICSTQTATAAGPGMTVTFRNVTPGLTVAFDEAKTSSGKVFPDPGSLTPGRDPMRNGKTMSGVSDNGELPDWVEFAWREWKYGVSETREELAAAPAYRRRVYIRQMIPQDVVDEVIAANLARKRGTLAKKWLRVYLVWYPGETKVHWEVYGGSQVLRSGGDELPVID